MQLNRYEFREICNQLKNQNSFEPNWELDGAICEASNDCDFYLDNFIVGFNFYASCYVDCDGGDWNNEPDCNIEGQHCEVSEIVLHRIADDKEMKISKEPYEVLEKIILSKIEIDQILKIEWWKFANYKMKAKIYRNVNTSN